METRGGGGNKEAWREKEGEADGMELYAMEGME